MHWTHFQWSYLVISDMPENGQNFWGERSVSLLFGRSLLIYSLLVTPSMPEKWQYDHSNILLFLCFDHHMCTCSRPLGNFLCLILQTLFVLCCKSFASKKAEMQLSSRLGLTLRRIRCRFGDKNVHGKPSAHSMQGFVEIKSTTLRSQRHYWGEYYY